MKHDAYEWLLTAFQHFVQHYARHWSLTQGYAPTPNPLVSIGEHLDIPAMINMPTYNGTGEWPNMADVADGIDERLLSFTRTLRHEPLPFSQRQNITQRILVLFALWETDASPSLMRGYVHQTIVQYLERCYADWMQERKDEDHD